jgi:ABC-2 type transport system permease protein
MNAVEPQGGHDRPGQAPSAPAAAPSGSVVPPTLPSLPVVFWLAIYSFRELARRRRLVSLALIVALPVLLVLALRIWYHGTVLTPRLVLATLAYHTYLPFLVPVVSLAVGVSAIGEQINEGTLIYPWSRPVKRGAIYTGRLLAAQLVASTLLVVSLVGCFLTTTAGRLELLSLGLLKLYVTTCFVLLLGTFAYTAVFALVGTLVRRPLLPCILFAFGWEPLVGGIPQRIQEYTLRFHLRNLIERPQAPPAEDMEGVLEQLIELVFRPTHVPEWRSLLVIVVVTIVATLLGIRILRSKEIVS